MALPDLKLSQWITMFIFWVLHVQVLSQANSDSVLLEKKIDEYIIEFRQSFNNAAYDDAFKTADKALDLISKHFGRSHIQYANFLGYLAGLHRETGNLELSDSLFRDSKHLFESAGTKDTFLFAAFLNEFGQLHTITGNYILADTLFAKSYALFEFLKNIDKSHLAVVLINWSGNSFSRGDFKSFEKQVLPAKTIYEELGQQMSPPYAVILMNLGAMYFETGRFDLAEPYFLKAKSLFEKLLGKGHPYFAQCILNLANIYSELANFEESLRLSLEAEILLKEMVGSAHPLYADCLVNIGSTYLNMGMFNESRTYYKSALEIWERTLGKQHFNYAFGAMSLGSVELKLAHPDEAKILLDEAIQVMKKSIGDEKVIYIKCLAYLADYCDQKGFLNQADSLYRYVLGELENLLGSENAYYLKTLSTYGNFCIKNEKHERADSLFGYITQISGKELIKATKHSTERQLSQFTVYYQQNLQSMLKYAQSRGTKHNPFTGYCYDNILMLRGFLLNSVQQMRNRSTADSGVAQLSMELGAISYRLGKEYSKSVSQRFDVTALETQAADIEKQLVIHISEYKNLWRSTNWMDVKSNLNSNEVAIEFVEYNPSKKNDADSLHYAALLIFSNSEQPLLLSLFQESQLNRILTTNIEGKQTSLAQVYSRGAKPLLVQSLDKIHDVLWKPMENYLKSVKTIYYAPSGLLHRINFDAIQINDSTNLADRFNLVRLGSSRSLVIPDVLKVDTSNSAILFGGINYDLDTTLDSLKLLTQEYSAVDDPEISFSYVGSRIQERGGDFNFLQGTEKEIMAASNLFNKANFKATQYSAEFATEESFKWIGKSGTSPRVLHIATHGFFFPDPDRTISAGGRMAHDPDSIGTTSEGTAKAASNKPKLESGTNEPVFKISEHPMIRSGLILAGGNYAWKYGKPYKERTEDGILTAYEISQMNLSNTELVVLSACETGLGDIQGNEGVYGLQRAFKIAGAKYIIMSLWQVPDKQTSMLMITFYKKWLEEKMSIPDAFRAAQKELRDFGLDPYQWAGFVLVE